MGREARARATREQDCLTVKVVHDPKRKQTTVSYLPDDPKLALQILGAGITALASELQRKPKAKGDEAPLLYRPTDAGRRVVEASRNRGGNGS